MPTQYTFITHWKIKAPLAETWELIHDSLHWPDWWKGVVAVKEITKGDENDIGTVNSYTWRSVLPYELNFTVCLIEQEKYEHIKGKASGELEGVGEWFFTEKEGVTHIQYNWTVFTNKAWMNYFSFLLKPIFKYNHNVIMRWGGKGLAKKLNAELISY